MRVLYLFFYYFIHFSFQMTNFSYLICPYWICIEILLYFQLIWNLFTISFQSSLNLFLWFLSRYCFLAFKYSTSILFSEACWQHCLPYRYQTQFRLQVVRVLCCVPLGLIVMRRCNCHYLCADPTHSQSPAPDPDPVSSSRLYFIYSSTILSIFLFKWPIFTQKTYIMRRRRLLDRSIAAPARFRIWNA